MFFFTIKKEHDIHSQLLNYRCRNV